MGIAVDAVSEVFIQGRVPYTFSYFDIRRVHCLESAFYV